MSAFTAKNYPITRAPRRLTLHGDSTRPEPAQHIIEFPGGAVELTRTTDGSYWAHVIVHRGRPMGDDGSLRESVRGEVVGARIDCDAGVVDVPHADSLTQIAVLVRPAAATAPERPGTCVAPECTERALHHSLWCAAHEVGSEPSGALDLFGDAA